MKGLIKLIYNDDKDAQKEIDEGKFKIRTRDGAAVFSHLWEILVEPGWKVDIQLGSQGHSKSDSPPISESSSDYGDEPYVDMDYPGLLPGLPLEEPAETLAADKKKSITLSHYKGEDYLLPWELCQTWEGGYLPMLHL